MASSQLTDGYSRITNKTLEALAKHGFPSRISRVLYAVFRYSYGYNRKTAYFARGVLSEVTGLKRQDLYRVLIQIECCNVCKIKRRGHCQEITFNKDWESWLIVGSEAYKKNVGRRASKRRPTGLQNVGSEAYDTRKIKDNKKERAAEPLEGSPLNTETPPLECHQDQIATADEIREIREKHFPRKTVSC